MASETGGWRRREFLGCCAVGTAGALIGGASSAGLAGCAVRSNENIRLAYRSGEGGTASQDWTSLRKEFLLDRDYCYFNSGGLGPSPRVVVETVAERMRALERFSESGHDHIAAVRRKACEFLNCAEDELALTRSTTEGMNAIARGLALKAGEEILLSTHEHPGGAMPWFALARDRGVTVRTFEVGASDGETMAHIRAAMTARTRVVSVSHVLCTTGAVLPVRQIGELCRERGVISVVDGAQAVGMIPVDLHELGCDFYAASGHKWMLGPKGTGVLYVRQSMLGLWRAPYVGAYSDDRFDLDEGVFEAIRAARSVEYGTRNVPLIEGLGAAIDFLSGLGMEAVAEYGQALAKRFRAEVTSIAPLAILTPDDKHCRASIVTIGAKNGVMDPWRWANALRKRYRIRVRPVGEHGLCGLRISLHIFNSEQQVERLVRALRVIAQEEFGT